MYMQSKYIYTYSSRQHLLLYSMARVMPVYVYMYVYVCIYVCIHVCVCVRERQTHGRVEDIDGLHGCFACLLVPEHEVHPLVKVLRHKVTLQCLHKT